MLLTEYYDTKHMVKSTVEPYVCQRNSMVKYGRINYMVVTTIEKLLSYSSNDIVGWSSDK